MRLQCLLLVCLTLLGLTVMQGLPAIAGGKSDAKVKATATATKPDANGKQTVTITLEIEKGWALYANPVDFALGGVIEQDLQPDRTRVTIRAKEKVNANVKYSVGKVYKENVGRQRIEYKIYDGVTKIEVAVERTPGDASPLQIDVHVQATDHRMFCLLPGTIKLNVP